MIFMYLALNISTTALPLLEDDDYWKVDEPMPTAPVTTGRHADDDYWDTKCKNSIMVDFSYKKSWMTFILTHSFWKCGLLLNIASFPRPHYVKSIFNAFVYHINLSKLNHNLITLDHSHKGTFFEIEILYIIWKPHI